jgi:hypothetical protein
MSGRPAVFVLASLIVALLASSARPTPLYAIYRHPHGGSAAHERAGLVSLLYVVSYLGLGGPAVLAGFGVVHGGGSSKPRAITAPR